MWQLSSVVLFFVFLRNRGCFQFGNSTYHAGSGSNDFKRKITKLNDSLGGNRNKLVSEVGTPGLLMFSLVYEAEVLLYIFLGSC